MAFLSFLDEQGTDLQGAAQADMDRPQADEADAPPPADEERIRSLTS